ISVTRAAPASLDAIDLSTKDADARRNVLPDGPSISLNKRATGKFYYELPQKILWIDNPEDEKCYSTDTKEIRSARNLTERKAVLYFDSNCVKEGATLYPGKSGGFRYLKLYGFKFKPAE
ncbi:hypothetical protein BGZ65_008098, partial [Modicella reniformis]